MIQNHTSYEKTCRCEYTVIIDTVNNTVKQFKTHDRTHKHASSQLRYVTQENHMQNVHNAIT